MINEASIELFVLKCASINSDLRRTLDKHDDRRGAFRVENDASMKQYVMQFNLSNRINANNMAEYYKIFYMLENDIRGLIVDTLESVHGPDWWIICVPPTVCNEAKKNQERENDAGLAVRSEREIDYTTFGQLGEIIRANWTDFAGMVRNQSSLSRVLHSLNMSRGTIAHCGVLGEDEIDRLKLNVKDWFRVLAGPST